MEAGKIRNKRGRKRQEVTNVAESTRIRVAQILEKFRVSNDEVYTFEENLTNHERAAVHILSRKMGMKSKSSGRGQQRRISVFKTKKEAGTLRRKENLVSFTFSGEAKCILQDLFSRYPPDDSEVTRNKVGESSGKTDQVRARGDDMFCKPTMTKSDITDKVESLVSRIEHSANLRQISEQKSKLPIASFKDDITSSIESHQVVLVCGETGCGKTTQVPQFLLDHAWSKGEACKIVCTQPRRISAMSVAERIASERGEGIGDSVGYKIRLESKGGRHSSLVFCTNGVLLKILVGEGSGRVKKKASKKRAKGVSDITHIIVDEIHERDRFSDFMLAIIRDILPSYPHLRVILMSATIDAERFSTYFGGCPVLRVPGFTYPVSSFYLEDVLRIVRSNETSHAKNMKHNETVQEDCKITLDEAINLAWSDDDFDSLLELICFEGDQNVFNYQHSVTGVTPLMVFAEKGRVADICMLLSVGVNCNLRSNSAKTALDYAQQANQGEAAEIIKKSMENTLNNPDEEQILLDKYLTSVDPEQIDYALIEKLLRRICNESKEGAILVFLPGWDDINKTQERLLSSPFFKDLSKFIIISLHSMVPLVEQKKVFKRPAPGCRKIVLSTNIAETSVTIDDVVYVVDSGRMKEKSYDPYNNVSTLHSSWISKASAKQREGRAGRCQPGICYRLYSKLRAASLPDFQVPEIKRMRIEELCLQVKLIDPSCKIEDFLQKTLDPPVYETIRNAIFVLQDIGALSDDENLTELGKKLGHLPVHPLTSKMLFLGILLNCLDPALTLACASEYREPFVMPMLPTEKKKAAVAKAELASFYGGRGDQLAVIAAFECWRMAKAKGDEARFCSKYFVSSSTMKMISGMRKQLEAELLRNGFISGDASRCSLNARDPGIIHAVLVAGLYPLIGRLVPHSNRSVVETVDGNKVRLHASSTNFKLSFNNFSHQPLIIFDEITRGDGGLHIRNCSVIGSLPLLLLATEIVVAPANENEEKDDSDSEEEVNGDDGDSDEDETENDDFNNFSSGKKIMSSPENSVKVVVDRWLPIESAALDVAQIYCLRERLSAAILFKVTHPHNLPVHLGETLYAIACILSYDGMSGISLDIESVDSLATMVSATDFGQKNYRDRTGINHSSKDHFNSHINRGGHHNPTYNQRGSSPGYEMINNSDFASTSYNRASISATSVNQNGTARYGIPVSRRNYSKQIRGNRFR